MKVKYACDRLFKMAATTSECNEKIMKAKILFSFQRKSEESHAKNGQMVLLKR